MSKQEMRISLVERCPECNEVHEWIEVRWADKNLGKLEFMCPETGELVILTVEQ